MACLRLGKFGCDPIALYHRLPVDELMDWIPAIDNLEARQGLESVDQIALATGNLEGAAADRVWDSLTRSIARWQPKPKRKPRKKGESPF